MNRGTRDTIAHVAGETEQALQPPGLEDQRDQAVGAPTDSRFRPTETSGIVTDRVRADLCALWAAIAMAAQRAQRSARTRSVTVPLVSVGLNLLSVGAPTAWSR